MAWCAAVVASSSVATPLGFQACTTVWPAVRTQRSSRTLGVACASRSFTLARGAPLASCRGPPCMAAVRRGGAPLSNSFQGFIDISPLNTQVMVTAANSSPVVWCHFIMPLG